MEEIKFKKNKNIEEVKSEEEYWEKHKIYKRKLNKLSKNFKLMLSNPDLYLNKFEELMNEMISYGIVSIDWANEHRKKMYDTLNYPNKFKTIVKEKINKLKNKIK